jgi:hypothetical protein
MLMHPEISRQVVQDHIENLRRDFSRSGARATAPHVTSELDAIELRLGRPDDTPALAKLAALEERPLPIGRFLLAEIEGCILAALPLSGGRPLRDPFEPTAHLLRLLELRAAQLTGQDPRRRGLRRLAAW